MLYLILMLELFFALAPVSIILLTSELLWRRKIVKGERARKYIHILSGIWMAFWPHYLTTRGVVLLGCIALIVLIYSRFTHLFHAIYAVHRRTYGDILYAVALIVCVLLALEPWIFTTAILLVAIADGGAAVVGRFYGLNNTYYVCGLRSLRKSLSGTAAFIVLAYASIAIGYFVGGEEIIGNSLIASLVLLPVGSTLLENTTPFGLDNLFTPLYAVLLLNTLV